MTGYWTKGSVFFLVSVTVSAYASAWGQQEPVYPSFAVQGQDKTIGPPQVIEIPLHALSPGTPSLSREAEHAKHLTLDQSTAGLVHSGPSVHHGYLGVLYATAEDGSAGVRVLDVIPGSPAERAGFFAPGPVPREIETVLNNTIFFLLLTPAFPLGILMSGTHEMYHRGLHDREDMIVAVDEQPVKDAQEFDARMHNFAPGDTVTFLVRRGNRYVRLTAQLEAEP